MLSGKVHPHLGHEQWVLAVSLQGRLGPHKPHSLGWENRCAVQASRPVSKPPTVYTAVFTGRALTERVGLDGIPGINIILRP